MPDFDDFSTDTLDQEDSTAALPEGWEEKPLDEKIKLLKTKLVERVYKELSDTSTHLDPALGNLARGIIKDMDVHTVSEGMDPALKDLLQALPYSKKGK